METEAKAASEARPRRLAAVVHVPGLDGHRAIAALLVLVFHVAGATDLTDADGLTAYIVRPFGALGVSLFFVLSGFLLYWPFVSAHLRNDPQPPIGRYLVRRALRIFPAYWLAFVVTVYVFGNADRTVQDVGDLVTFLTLQQGYDTRLVLAGVPVAWTLSIEVTFYVFLPVFALIPLALAGKRASARERFHIQLASVAGLFVLAMLVRYLLIDSDAKLVGVFPAMADWFAVGMVLAVLRSWYDLGRVRPRVLETLRRRPGIGLIGAALAFAGVVSLQLDGGFVRMAVGDHMVRNALFAVFGACLIGPVALGADVRSPLVRVLENRVLRWFGLVSYGIYLWHTLVIKELRPALVEHLGMSSGFWPTLVVTIAASAVVAAASWYLLEKPIIAWGRRRERRPVEPGTGGRSS